MPNDSSPSPARSPAPNRALPAGTIIPDSSSPAFPKLPHAKRPDFSAAVRLFVPEAARLFESLFPNYPGCLTTNADIARRFYKAWKRGALSLPDLKLLARYWATARQGEVAWRQSHPGQFLDRGKLIGPAIAACREARQMAIEEAEFMLSFFEDREEDGMMLPGQLLIAKNALKDWDASGRPIVQYFEGEIHRVNLAAVCLWLCDERWAADRMALRQAYNVEIREDLRRFKSWLALVQREKLDPFVVWGLQAGELGTMITAEHERLKAELERARQ